MINSVASRERPCLNANRSRPSAPTGSSLRVFNAPALRFYYSTSKACATLKK
jgi:hypothetical protein